MPPESIITAEQARKSPATQRSLELLNAAGKTFAQGGVIRHESEQTYRFRGHTKPDQSVADFARAVKPQALLEPALVVNGKATLYLYDVIDSWGGAWGISATEFNTALNSLGNDVNEIELHVNSPGGEVYEGIAILNSLRNHPARIVAHVDGLAASAASFIAAGADELIMGGNSQLMIHDAWGICIGAAADMHELGDRLDKISDNIASIYQAKAGGDLPGWRSAMLAESWYDADEAVNIGLADSTNTPEEGTGDEPANSVDPIAFDLSVFKYEGRDKAPAPNSTQVQPEPEPNRRAFQERRHRMNERRASAHS
jgi:ATP-dependent protease ClpP protease subunit